MAWVVSGGGGGGGDEAPAVQYYDVALSGVGAAPVRLQTINHS